MRTRLNTGFTLLEMVVAIVVIAILMAMAAPLIVHLVDSYTASAEGADLASAVGPAVWQMERDSRNASSMTVNTTNCTLILTEPAPLNAKIKYRYVSAQGSLFQILPGATPVLILAHLTVPAGGCPFVLQNAPNPNTLVTYDWRYVGPSGQGNLTVEGALSAYAY